MPRSTERYRHLLFESRSSCRSRLWRVSFDARLFTDLVPPLTKFSPKYQNSLLYSLSARSHIPIVWIVFIGLSALTSIQGWTLQPTARASSEDEESKDERPESGSAGYGAVGTTGETARKPVFTVVEAKTRAEWLECVGIRIEGQFSSSH
jgi:hypothetical protein